MKQRKRQFLVLKILILSLILTGCSSEIARVSMQSVGHYGLDFSHDGRPITLWTDLDVEYIDDTEIWYEIQFNQNGGSSQVVTCNPYDHKYRLMSRQTVVRGVTKESFLAPMECEVDLPAGEIRAEIDFYAVGGRVRIFRADLVINEGD